MFRQNCNDPDLLIMLIIIQARAVYKLRKCCKLIELYTVMQNSNDSDLPPRLA